LRYGIRGKGKRQSLSDGEAEKIKRNFKDSSIFDEGE
jgi:hypothetical protein